MKTVRINDLVKRNKQILRRRKVIEKKIKRVATRRQRTSEGVGTKQQLLCETRNGTN